MLSWTVRLNGGPQTYGYGAVAVGHKVYSFAGYRLNVHIFNTVTLRWTRLPPVTGGRGERPLEFHRCRAHTAVLIEDIVYFWGGLHYGNALYAFDVDTHSWFKPRTFGSVPETRRFHSACVLEKVMYVYGGDIWNLKYTNDIYKLDTATMFWALINTTGTVSSNHSATIIGTKMFVFGGQMSSMQQHYNPNNIRVFDTETNCWLSMPSALPYNYSHQSAFAYNGELYIFGDFNQTSNDLWKINPETFSCKNVKPKGKGPSGRIIIHNHCMVGDRIIFFGRRTKTDTPDLFILDLGRPCLKTLCKLAVIQYGLEKSGLPHNIRWELAAMTTNSNRT